MVAQSPFEQSGLAWTLRFDAWRGTGQKYERDASSTLAVGGFFFDFDISWT